MSKMNALFQDKLEKAQALSDRWEELEEDGTGEMAAYAIACEQLEIAQDEGWELLRFLSAHEKQMDQAP